VGGSGRLDRVTVWPRWNGAPVARVRPPGASVSQPAAGMVPSLTVAMRVAAPALVRLHRDTVRPAVAGGPGPGAVLSAMAVRVCPSAEKGVDLQRNRNAR
jgi:hypothetical protein